MNSKAQLQSIKNDIISLRKLMNDQDKVRKKIRTVKDRLMMKVDSNQTVKIGRYSIYWGNSNKTRISLTDARKYLSEADFNKVTYTAVEESWKLGPPRKKRTTK